MQNIHQINPIQREMNTFHMLLLKRYTNIHLREPLSSTVHRAKFTGGSFDFQEVGMRIRVWARVGVRLGFGVRFGFGFGFGLRLRLELE
jgi:hypothetical protein